MNTPPKHPAELEPKGPEEQAVTFLRLRERTSSLIASVAPDDYEDIMRTVEEEMEAWYLRYKKREEFVDDASALAYVALAKLAEYLLSRGMEIVRSK